MFTDRKAWIQLDIVDQRKYLKYIKIEKGPAI